MIKRRWSKWSKADVTPCLMVRNEEFWIHYVIKDLVEFFKQAIIIDTGSTDLTIPIIHETLNDIEGSYVQIFREQWGNDATKMGEGRNMLRILCNTHWMLLVDGDEVWRRPQLELLMDGLQNIRDATEVIMVGGQQVEEVNGRLVMRDGDLANVDRLHNPVVRWTALEYPFEGHGLHEDRLPRGVVEYINANEAFCWHVRHTKRSRYQAYMREEKKGYFPWKGPWKELPQDWVVRDPRFPNPYFEIAKVGEIP